MRECVEIGGYPFRIRTWIADTCEWARSLLLFGHAVGQIMKRMGLKVVEVEDAYLDSFYIRNIHHHMKIAQHSGLTGNLEILAC